VTDADGRETPPRSTGLRAWLFGFSIALAAALVAFPLALLTQVLAGDRDVTSPAPLPGGSSELPSASGEEIDESTGTEMADEPVTSLNEPGFVPIELTLYGAEIRNRCTIENWGGYSWDDDSPSISGTQYPNGFSCPLRYSAAAGSVDYLVPSGATEFAVTAGQADTSRNTTLMVRFEVIDVVSGRQLAIADLAFGQQARFAVPVSGVVRLSLRVSVLSWSTPPKEAPGDAAWGGAVFS